MQVPELVRPFVERFERLAIHRWALAHRRMLDLDGMTVAVAPIEYVIVRKLEYYEEGRSEKHLRRRLEAAWARATS